MTRNEFLEEFDNLSNEDKRVAHNRYCEDANYMGDFIYMMDELDDFVSIPNNWDELIQLIDFENFKDWHTYAHFTAYGYLESIDSNNLDGFIYASDIYNEYEDEIKEMDTIEEFINL